MNFTYSLLQQLWRRRHIFHELGVTDVIRLNEPRYDGGAFASRGIAHHDLRFDDCTANQRSTCLNLTPA